MSRATNKYAVIAIVAWAAVPALWSMSTIVDRTQRWEETPRDLYQLGALALLLGGVFTLLAILRHVRPGRPRARLLMTGFAFYGLALLVSALGAWALPIWMIFYGVAFLLVGQAVGRIRPALRFMGLAMLSSIGIMIVLTMLKPGRPDTFGDYPIAWTTAYFVATLCAAAGSLALSRYETEPSDEQVAVPVG